MPRWRTHASTRLRSSSPVLALLALLLVAGCATLAELAPPVGAREVQLAESRGIGAESIERGRDLYVTSCARCHRPEAVSRYERDEWTAILPRMAHAAALTEEDLAAVKDYVTITLAAGADADDGVVGSDPEDRSRGRSRTPTSE